MKAQRKVFLDLGTHYGQGLRHFIEKYHMDKSWIIHTFEANPKTYKKFLDNHHKMTPWVISHNKAVSSKNGKIIVNGENYLDEHGTGQGSSIISKDNWNTNQEFAEKFEVGTIDLSEFIKNTCNPSDFIVVKMDIEGAEYDSLERLIDTGVISYINDLYVEWHLRCFVDKESVRLREENLKDYLLKKVPKFENWI